MDDIGLLLLGAVFVNNIVLVKLFGLSPFVGGSRQLDGAYGIALATGALLPVSSALAWIVQHGVLVPLGLEALRTFAFLVVIAAVVQCADIALRRRRPRLHRVLGPALPLVAINCAILGTTLQSVQERHTFVEALVHGVGAAAGFGLVLVMFAAMRERLEVADVPVAWRGTPIALVTAGLMSLAFMGFAGMVPAR